ncbi:MAG TPA: FtsW/RodA/SpoVE family cell cycle protein [Tepidisphaeraceae bacterium]|nr:FtsW/RodA/SpoVE family cell cycle protein [Tepidisphaeraceae bacterium]
MSSVWRQLGILTNWPVLVALAVLSTLGVLSIWANQPDDASKQILFLVLAIACMTLFQAIDYRKIGHFSFIFYGVSLLFLIYTVVPFTHVPSGDSRPLRVPETHGAYAWINFGPLRFQPAEMMKIAFIMVMARYLRFRSNYRTLRGLLPPFALALVPLALILVQPDLGTALIFIPALFIMLFVAGAKIRHLLAVVALGVATGPFLWLCGSKENGAPGLPVLNHLPTFVKRYQRDRVYAMFKNDSMTLRSTGMQQHRALTALGSGGFGGKGLGNIPVSKHLPEANNDMIFAVVGEQFGLFGSAAVLMAYIVLFAAGIEIAAATREPFGKLLAVGVVALLAGQTFLNLMVATKLMPVTGVTLPFMSYGGSSLLASFMAAGLLLNIGQNRPLVMANNAFEFVE